MKRFRLTIDVVARHYSEEGLDELMESMIITLNQDQEGLLEVMANEDIRGTVKTKLRKIK